MSAYRFPWSKSTDIRVRKAAETEIGSLLLTLDALGRSLGFSKSMSSSLGWTFERSGASASEDDLGTIGISGLRKELGLGEDHDTDGLSHESTDHDHFDRYESSITAKTNHEKKIKVTKDLVVSIVKDLVRPGYLEGSLKALKKLQKAWADSPTSRSDSVTVRSFFQYL
jgi:hypothetical protein